MGAYASGGELNPAKWNSSAFITIGAAGASAGASAVATNLTNNYLDNYNKPPVLGFSAVGPGNDIHSFVNDNNFSFKDDPNNTYQDTKSSGLNGDLATIGSLLGGVSGMLNEFSIMQFYNAAPKGTFAVNYNGSLRYWSESFKGGTRANIPSVLVESAKIEANSVKFVSKLGSSASILGTGLSYYGAGEEFINGNYGKSGVEAMSSTISLGLSAKKGNIVGLAWTIGWEGGRWISNRDFYDEWYRNTWHPYRYRYFGY
ncbi:hypothetical protein D0809_13500 [Flavobacterium circumlabens]|uniref:Uncharacterized protein n=1 Tax=Flavobacterium circumlabens TaxID=2133765 RepID=A0A4Y7UDL2_9FLAO|nr:hypothetical protein [Flavobacterium circumlabens]TCN57594.1 hypothetical protein EV142_104254 [Flavobacterium circumlabens]TEB43902.1 hypothetical protein D0809_13500 [Flavobacterium circumlabens]